MLPVLEAVPNFSEGRDLDLVRELVGVIARRGVDVLDWSADADHHRSVVTFLGEPAAVEDAAVAAAGFAMEHIDLREHRGVHPRIGAIDVLPLVPLSGATLEDAAASARRIGARLSAMGLPVYFYGAASSSDTTLARLRRGGFEGLRGGFPGGREPDLPAPQHPDRPHPSAGAVCVGARPVLLAWNVVVEGVDQDTLRVIAAGLRESGGGFPSLRTLALTLPGRDRLQLSMNLEDPETVSPLSVFEAIEERLAAHGARVVETEVIGMMPDPLVLHGAADRLRIQDSSPSRLLSARLADHLAHRATTAVEDILHAIALDEASVPARVLEAARRVAVATGHEPNPGDWS